METIIIPNGTQAEVANYKKQVISDYENNPLIEALPSIVPPELVIERLASYPSYSNDERYLDSYYRIHIINRIFEVFQPLPLTIELESRISRVMRQGYIYRNPFNKQLTQGFREGYNLMKGINPPINRTSYQSAYGFTLIGISGLGKTSSIDHILSQYPQVIVHSEFKGIPFSAYQLTWLKLECPHDASIKGLLFEFFSSIDQLLGTNYYIKMVKTRPTVDIMLTTASQIIRSCFCGILIIDEIQHLSVAKSGGSEKMLNFFVNIVNNVGIPVVLVGTPKALRIVQSEFRQARRGSSGVGGDMICDRMQKDRAWELLVSTIWHYQWTKKETPLTQEFVDLLYEETQGIPDLLKKIYAIAQAQAISTGKEEITPALIKRVAKENLKLVQPMITALKTGDVRRIASYEDVFVGGIDLGKYIDKARQKTDISSPVKANKEDKSKIMEQKEIIEKKEKRTKGEYTVDDLRFIVDKGKQENKSAFETLMEAGYIKTFENDIFTVR